MRRPNRVFSEVSLDVNSARTSYIILSKLNAAAVPHDMAEPRHRLHRLEGYHPPRYSIRLTANWRVTFEMQDGDVFNLDIEDYH